jgi:hypothetical protein
VSPEVTDENDCAAELSSADNPSQAAAACSNGPEPAPANISAELVSGGNSEKFIVFAFQLRFPTCAPVRFPEG